MFPATQKTFRVVVVVGEWVGAVDVSGRRFGRAVAPGSMGVVKCRPAVLVIQLEGQDFSSRGSVQEVIISHVKAVMSRECVGRMW